MERNNEMFTAEQVNKAINNLLEGEGLECCKDDCGHIIDYAPKRIVYKYNIEENNVITGNIEQVLDVQIQNGIMMAWVLLNPIYPEKSVAIDIIGTGWIYGNRRSKYLRTLQDGDLVWHVFVRNAVSGEI